MTLLIDNYDSFTFNLYQMIKGLGEACVVIRNDQTDLARIEQMNLQSIVLSPGPGHPDEAGITLAVIRHFADRIPILGVCLGHQAIGQAFGGKVIRAKSLMHGKQSKIYHTGQGLFEGIECPLLATRYHSLVVDRKSLPDCFEITGESEDGLVMGLRHKSLPVEGVQFHPESVATENGEQMLKTFLRRCA